MEFLISSIESNTNEKKPSQITVNPSKRPVKDIEDSVPAISSSKLSLSKKSKLKSQVLLQRSKNQKFSK